MNGEGAGCPPELPILLPAKQAHRYTTQCTVSTSYASFSVVKQRATPLGPALSSNELSDVTSMTMSALGEGVVHRGYKLVVPPA